MKGITWSGSWKSRGNKLTTWQERRHALPKWLLSSMGPRRRWPLPHRASHELRFLPLPLIRPSPPPNTLVLKELHSFLMRRLRRPGVKLTRGRGKPRSTRLVVSRMSKGKEKSKMRNGCLMMLRRLRQREAESGGKPLISWQWRWLILSPARHNEALMLELSRAWEPLNSSGPSPYGD
jgi:hypothetical protein